MSIEARRAVDMPLTKPGIPADIPDTSPRSVEQVLSKKKVNGWNEILRIAKRNPQTIL